MKRMLLALERTDDGSGAVSFAQSLAQDRRAEILLLRVEEWPLFGSFGAFPAGGRAISTPSAPASKRATASGPASS